MKFEPFLADLLMSGSAGHMAKPVQLSLMPEIQKAPKFVFRQHRATRLHFDFRLQVLRTGLSLVAMHEPSLDPDRPLEVRLMPDHDPKYFESERVIPEGQPGAGPTMPVDLGTYVPQGEMDSTYDCMTIAQLLEGDFRFTLFGTHLQGGWQLARKRADLWLLRKLEDEFASTDRVLVLDRSIKTGRTLDEVVKKFGSGTPRRGRDPRGLSAIGLWNAEEG